VVRGKNGYEWECKNATLKKKPNPGYKDEEGEGDRKEAVVPSRLSPPLVIKDPSTIHEQDKVHA